MLQLEPSGTGAPDATKDTSKDNGAAQCLVHTQGHAQMAAGERVTEPEISGC